MTSSNQNTYVKNVKGEDSLSLENLFKGDSTAEDERDDVIIIMAMTAGAMTVFIIVVGIIYNCIKISIKRQIRRNHSFEPRIEDTES